jgi:hypothetical protein
MTSRQLRACYSTRHVIKDESSTIEDFMARCSRNGGSYTERDLSGITGDQGAKYLSCSRVQKQDNTAESTGTILDGVILLIN